MKNKEISLSKICFTLTLLVLSLYIILSFGNSYLGKTRSYLTDNGTVMGVIMLEGVDLMVLQDINLADDVANYVDVEDEDYGYGGIVLGTNSLATDKSYDYSVILRNNDVNETHYLRWKIEASVDGVTTNMTEFCSTNATNVVYSDGYLYLVDSNNKSTTLKMDDSGTTAKENEVEILSNICVTGTYDADAHKVSESFLDDPAFSGRDIVFNLTIEGSGTAYTIG